MVADYNNNRVCVLSMSGAFVRSLSAGVEPRDVVECDGGAAFIVANYHGHTVPVCKVTAATGAVAPFDGKGSGYGQFKRPVALAVVPCGRGDAGPVELTVLELGNNRIHVFRA